MWRHPLAVGWVTVVVVVVAAVVVVITPIYFTASDIMFFGYFLFRTDVTRML
jgi:hypothetical protein